jgi:hypothetical protein
MKQKRKGRLVDETGNVYGRLTVLERAQNTRAGGAQWLCKCECGNKVAVQGTHLRSGNTVSCGCWKSEYSARINPFEVIEMVGHRQGRLVVVKRAKKSVKKGEARWICRCDCGTVFEVVGSNLRNGCTRSCGCIQHEMCGENSPTWRGGVSFEPYDAQFNDRFKERVRKRDHYACRLCGISTEENGQAMDVHHIDYDKLNSVMSNCVSLCRSCHTKTSHNRDYWVAYFADNFDFVQLASPQ